MIRRALRVWLLAVVGLMAIVSPLSCGGDELGSGRDAGSADGSRHDAGSEDGNADRTTRTSDWNFMFVTSMSYGPIFGSVEAADAVCNAAALSAGLGGTFRAWLSTQAVGARDRLQGARGWIRVDGIPFADSIDDIVNGRLFSPPWIDENGADLGDSEHWQVTTGTSPDGTYDGPSPEGAISRGGNCQDWMDPEADYQVGDIRTTTGLWTTGAVAPSTCTVPFGLYCFGVDKAKPLTPVAVVGRRAFLSEGVLTAGGVDGADMLCAGEAAAAGLSGTFKALVSTETASAASRVTSSPDTVWVRLDGLRINPAGVDLLDATRLLVPINVTSQLHYLDVWVAMGAGTPNSAPDVDACNSWNSVSIGKMRDGLVSRTSEWFSGIVDDCAQRPVHVYCLED